MHLARGAECAREIISLLGRLVARMAQQNLGDADMFWVAAAGPGANLFMALVWAILLKFSGPLDAQSFFAAMCIQGITINVVLMVLNLLPIPPLDGGRIMVSILPNSLAFQFAKLERFGFPIIILLMVTGALSVVMNPLVSATLRGIQAVFGF